MSKVMSPPAEAPPSTGPRTRRPSRLRRVAVWILWIILVVVMAALAATAALEAADARRFPAPGEPVELSDGRKLHLHVAGEQHGGTTVVLEAGHGGFSPTFAWLQAELAEVTTVVSYDRPGYGWSDPTDGPASAEGTVTDLHEALTERGLPGPYLLVGHSLGGFYVRVFADRYPDDVAGLVLLDPSHEDQMQHLPAEMAEQTEQMNRILPWTPRIARLGVFRLYSPQGFILDDLPEDAAGQLGAISTTAAYWRAYAGEAAVFDDLADAVPADFGGQPVRVVSAPVAEEGMRSVRDTQDRLHRELASRSTHATHHEVPGAEHITLITERQHARASADIVLELLADIGATSR